MELREQLQSRDREHQEALHNLKDQVTRMHALVHIHTPQTGTTAHACIHTLTAKIRIAVWAWTPPTSAWIHSWVKHLQWTLSFLTLTERLKKKKRSFSLVSLNAKSVFQPSHWTVAFSFQALLLLELHRCFISTFFLNFPLLPRHLSAAPCLWCGDTAGGHTERSQSGAGGEHSAGERCSED